MLPSVYKNRVHPDASAGYVTLLQLYHDYRTECNYKRIAGRGIIRNVRIVIRQKVPDVSSYIVRQQITNR